MPGASGKNKELPGGCLAIFGLPFLLAGLALMWFAGLKPLITALDTRMNRIEARGDSQKLRTLDLNLVGCTETVIASGKGSKTIKEVFKTIPLRRIEGILRKSGSITTDPPADLRPSDGTVEWRITVHAEVSGGVNVATDHPVEILAKQKPFA